MLFAGALAALAVPAAAQDRNAAAGREDFQCVVWVSILATTPIAQDPTVQTGFNVALGYFVGQYEAKTGRGVDDNWDRAAAEEVAANLDRFAGICGGRMQTFGDRLQTLGASMVEYSNSGMGK